MLYNNIINLIKKKFKNRRIKKSHTCPRLPVIPYTYVMVKKKNGETKYSFSNRSLYILVSQSNLI